MEKCKNKECKKDARMNGSIKAEYKDGSLKVEARGSDTALIALATTVIRNIAQAINVPPVVVGALIVDALLEVEEEEEENE